MEKDFINIFLTTNVTVSKNEKLLIVLMHQNLLQGYGEHVK